MLQMGKSLIKICVGSSYGDNRDKGIELDNDSGSSIAAKELAKLWRVAK
jgi:hypothetical protein